MKFLGGNRPKSFLALGSFIMLTVVYPNLGALGYVILSSRPVWGSQSGVTVGSDCVETLSAADRSALDRLDMNYVKPIVLGWIRRFDLPRTLFVGVGRSPAPFIAFLQALKKNSSDIHAVNVPFSRHWTTLSALEKYLNQIEVHFDTYLPAAQLEKYSTIVFVDYTNSGQALKTAAAAFALYSEAHGSMSKIHLIALEGGYFSSTAIPYDHISLPGPMNSYLENKLFSDFAEFGTFKLDKDGHYQQVVKNENYQKLLQFMTQYITGDPDPLNGQTAQEITTTARAKSQPNKDFFDVGACQMPYCFEASEIGRTPKEILKVLRDAPFTNNSYIP